MSIKKRITKLADALRNENLTYGFELCVDRKTFELICKEFSEEPTPFFAGLPRIQLDLGVRVLIWCLP